MDRGKVINPFDTVDGKADLTEDPAAWQRDFSRALLKLLRSTPGAAGGNWAPECFTFLDKLVEMRALFDCDGNALPAWRVRKNHDL